LKERAGRRRKPKIDRAVGKLAKAVTAKTRSGRLNYLTDFVFDEALENPILDEIAHFMIECGLSEGKPEDRFMRWLKKAAKYRSR